ncbi:MAG: hypothetical protein PHG51_07005, partial [Candidatus Omnitrophica bacterium]|nr:hypothetical protein [Candidatus Omnitrophota bacterium]
NIKDSYTLENVITGGLVGLGIAGLRYIPTASSGINWARMAYGAGAGGAIKVTHDWIKTGDNYSLGQGVASFLGGAAIGGLTSSYLTVPPNIPGALRSFYQNPAVLYQSSVRGALEWTYVSPAFTAGGAFWKGTFTNIEHLIDGKSAVPMFALGDETKGYSSLFSKEGAIQLLQGAVYGPRSGLWMAPGISIFQVTTANPNSFMAQPAFIKGELAGKAYSLGVSMPFVVTGIQESVNYLGNTGRISLASLSNAIDGKGLTPGNRTVFGTAETEYLGWLGFFRAPTYQRGMEMATSVPSEGKGIEAKMERLARLDRIIERRQNERLNTPTSPIEGPDNAFVATSARQGRDRILESLVGQRNTLARELGRPLVQPAGTVSIVNEGPLFRPEVSVRKEPVINPDNIRQVNSALKVESQIQNGKIEGNSQRLINNCIDITKQYLTSAGKSFEFRSGQIAALVLSLKTGRLIGADISLGKTWVEAVRIKMGIDSGEVKPGQTIRWEVREDLFGQLRKSSNGILDALNSDPNVRVRFLDTPETGSFTRDAKGKEVYLPLVDRAQEFGFADKPNAKITVEIMGPRAAQHVELAMKYKFANAPSKDALGRDVALRITDDTDIMLRMPALRIAEAGASEVIFEKSPEKIPQLVKSSKMVLDLYYQLEMGLNEGKIGITNALDPTLGKSDPYARTIVDNSQTRNFILSLADGKYTEGPNGKLKPIGDWAVVEAELARSGGSDFTKFKDSLGADYKDIAGLLYLVIGWSRTTAGTATAEGLVTGRDVYSRYTVRKDLQESFGAANHNMAGRKGLRDPGTIAGDKAMEIMLSARMVREARDSGYKVGETQAAKDIFNALTSKTTHEISYAETLTGKISGIQSSKVLAFTGTPRSLGSAFKKDIGLKPYIVSERENVSTERNTLNLSGSGLKAGEAFDAFVNKIKDVIKTQEGPLAILINVDGEREALQVRERLSAEGISGEDIVIGLGVDPAGRKEKLSMFRERVSRVSDNGEVVVGIFQGDLAGDNALEVTPVNRNARAFIASYGVDGVTNLTQLSGRANGQGRMPFIAGERLLSVVPSSDSRITDIQRREISNALTSADREGIIEKALHNV